MNLDRIFLATELPNADRIELFLASDAVKKQKFGTLAPTGQRGIRQLIQPDNFRITIVGRVIQVNYSLPADVQDIEEDPFEHTKERLRRFIKAVSSIGDGEVNWCGLQCFFEDIDEKAKNVSEALQNWRGSLDTAILPEAQISNYQLQLGFRNGDYFESLNSAPFETRYGNFNPGELVEVEKQTEVAAAGMGYMVDINTKPRNSPDRLDKAIGAIFDRMRDRSPTIIAWGRLLLMGEKINV